jgi:RNA polymerase sigma-70 factor (ECF subfamily)
MAMKIDERNFKTIYNTYFEGICRFLNYYTHDSFAIEEIVQDVFVHLWNERHSQDIKFIKTYLYCSARNKMLNYLRDKENHDQLLNKWAQQQLNEQGERDCVDRNEFSRLLQIAIEELPEKCREIFILSRNEKLTYKEIAEIQNISIKTVENQMGIALKKIRAKLLSCKNLLKLIIIYILYIL